MHASVRRRTLAIAAATLVVVGGSALGVAVAREHRDAPVRSIVGVPPTVDYQGTTWTLIDATPWDGSQVDHRSGTTITVRAGEAAAPSACHALTRGFVASSSVSSVTLTTARYAAPDGAGAACTAEGFSPGVVSVDLPAAIGERSVVDGSDGRTRKLVDATALPTLTSVPAGFVLDPVVTSGSLLDNLTIARTWTKGEGNQQQTISITSFAVAAGSTAPVPAGSKVALRGTVQGHPATVTIDPNFPNDARYLTWQQDATNAVSLSVRGSPTSFTVAQTLAMAQSFTP